VARNQFDFYRNRGTAIPTRPQKHALTYIHSCNPLLYVRHDEINAGRKIFRYCTLNVYAVYFRAAYNFRSGHYFSQRITALREVALRDGLTTS
jgi:hypothetical protein